MKTDQYHQRLAEIDRKIAFWRRVWIALEVAGAAVILAALLLAAPARGQSYCPGGTCGVSGWEPARPKLATAQRGRYHSESHAIQSPDPSRATLDVDSSSLLQSYNPPSAVNGKGILNEVLSRSTKPNYYRQKYGRDLATLAHETAHDVSNRITNEIRRDGMASYQGDGKFVYLKNPRVSISTVARYVPSQYRDQIYFRNYLVNLASNPTLILLDEWSAAVLGWITAYENGVSDTGDRRMAHQFSHYADALIRAIRAHDPNYRDLEKLERFVAWQKARIADIDRRVSRVARVSGGNSRSACVPQSSIRRTNPTDGRAILPYRKKLEAEIGSLKGQLADLQSQLSARGGDAQGEPSDGDDAASLRAEFAEYQENLRADIKHEIRVQVDAAVQNQEPEIDYGRLASEIDTDRLANSLQQAVSVNIDTNQLADDVAKRMPPIHMRVSPDAPYQSVSPGQYVTLPLNRVQ